MTTVYFVRHAQTDYRNPIDKDRVLTDEGMRCRLKARDYLIAKQTDRNRTHIYSSDFRRSIDTIRPFADYMGIDVIPCQAFREWSVIAPEKEYYALCQRAWLDFDYRFQECETMREVQQRNVKQLLELVRKHQGDTLVIGSHGVALSTVIHFFNPWYDYQDVLRIMDLKPWIVKFEFEGSRFMSYQEVFPYVGKEFTEISTSKPDVMHEEVSIEKSTQMF